MIGKMDLVMSLYEHLPIIKTTTTNKRLTYYELPCGFDIETTSFYDSGFKCAIMYEWTFGFGVLENGEFKNYITYGRKWEELTALLDVISGVLNLNPTSRRLVCYVHNLPYEWQFMRRYFKWHKVFYIDDRKPVYAIATNGIEFRCSFKLSGKSLAKTAYDLTKYPVHKMVGDLDYSLIRHQETPLTEKELGYCENDVAVILSYIQEKIEEEGTITNIPLTKTGYVRRYCRKASFPKVSESEMYDGKIDLERPGVYSIKRSIPRGFYSRKCEISREALESDWLLGFCFELSGDDSGLSISYDGGFLYW